MLNGLPTRVNLVDRGIHIPFSLRRPTCVNQHEDTSHVFMFSKVADQVWHSISNWVDLQFKPQIKLI